MPAARSDKRFNCNSWAKGSECKSNAIFMKSNCPESCKKYDDGSGDGPRPALASAPAADKDQKKKRRKKKKNKSKTADGERAAKEEL